MAIANVIYLYFVCETNPYTVVSEIKDFSDAHIGCRLQNHAPGHKCMHTSLYGIY